MFTHIGRSSSADVRVDKLVEDKSRVQEDLGQLTAWISWVESQLDDLKAELASTAPIEPVKPVDLKPVWDRIHLLSSSIPVPCSCRCAEPVDLGPLKAELAAFKSLPPKQITVTKNLEHHHTHTYLPRGDKWLWCAIGMGWLMAAVGWCL